MKMRKFVWARPLWLIALLIALMSFSAFAQSDVASISGFVRDASGSVVPGAKVVGVLIDPNYQEADAQARELPIFS